MARGRKPLLAELHAHTTWSDGVLTPAELVDLYGRAGFDVLAITDHVVRSEVACHVRAETYRDYLEQIDSEAERARVHYGMVVVPGLELTVENADPRRAGHAVAVGLREFVSVDAGARPQGDSARSLNIQDVPDSTIRPGMKMSFVERRIRRIVNARSVTLGLAVTFIGLALVGGVIIRFVDKENFPSVGLGIWWALQTVTTVGYGDVVPTSVAGRTIGGLEMVIGIAFISFVTAGVTSALVQRANQAAQEADIAKQEEAEQRILDELGRTNQALADLGRRLETIDSKLAG